jgi:hypothetical protein
VVDTVMADTVMAVVMVDTDTMVALQEAGDGDGHGNGTGRGLGCVILSTSKNMKNIPLVF